VQKNDRVACADIDIAHLGIEYLDAFSGMIVSAGKLRYRHFKTPFGVSYHFRGYRKLERQYLLPPMRMALFGNFRIV
jgi:hypothetical protein